MNIANIPNKTIEFLKQVRMEMKKVNWPTRGETVKYTLMVIGVSVAVAAYLGGLDVLINNFVNKLISQ